MITIPSTPLPTAAPRRSWTASEKAKAVRRHLRDDVSVADLAEELGTAPTQVYAWIKQVLERAELALTDKREKSDQRTEKTLAAKEQRIRHLEEVTAELSMEVLQLKKSRGAT
jgi:transposase-like protein